MTPSHAVDVAPAPTRDAPFLRVRDGALLGDRDRRLIQRTALVRKLVAGRERPIALLVAPPGYGKSTLLAQWAQADERVFIWASGTRGWSKLAQLIRSAHVQHRTFVVVVDDADQLGHDVLNALVSAALNELPLNCTIALAARAEPRIPLARLRAHRMLVELRAEELALTASEAETLLRRERVHVPQEDRRAILRRTQGWAAPLYLAALSIRETPGGPDSCAGPQHLVSEYLSDEVLGRLSEELRRFAVRTSVAGELTGPLCDALLDQHGSGVTLDALARLSMPLSAVDAAHHRYRWHPLVRDALLSELRRDEPELESELHRRASVWHAECGEVDAAIEHAAHAGDARLAGDLLYEHLVTYAARGRSRLLVRWLVTLRRERVASQPTLALAAALSCLTSGQLDEAQAWSVTAGAAAERSDVRERHPSLASGLCVVQALVEPRSVRAIGERAEASAAVEPKDSQWRPYRLLLAGVSAHLRGEPESARQILDAAITGTGNIAPSVTALCLAQRAMIAIEDDDWELVGELTDRAKTVIEEWHLDNGPMAALPVAVLAAAKAHDRRGDEAKAALRRALDLLAATGEFLPWYGAEVRILLAHTSLRLADIGAARTLLAEASRLARKVPDAVAFARWFDEAWGYMDTLAENRLAGSSSLTIAELRILRFLPSHRSFREIALQLGVSANTVKTQAHAVYRKLGAGSRSEAVARAREAGLLG
jgi:LuxR family transcriptional regulator, maltose regulon positive regulatory protein